ncbi:MAG: magnesium transporter CorA family protein [Clostridia bacterium]
MIKYIIAQNSNITELDSICEGCWVSLIDPSEEEILEIHKKTNVDLDALQAALDEEERSRIEIEDEYTMIVVDIPTSEEKHSKQTYVTIPMSIILAKNNIITVCSEENDIFSPFEQGKIRNFYTNMRTRFILQLLYRNASLFLHYLRSINKKSEIVERRLHNSTQNKELIQLMELERSLLYFTTSLRSNEIVLEKLLKLDSIKKYPEDEDLLEDTIIENKQAIEMANIYNGILAGMMDAFASIISNNLNIVMKILAVVTIVMSIPTMIFSAYGMNVNVNGMPLANSPWGFLAIITLCIVLVLISLLIFAKSKMFK